MPSHTRLVFAKTCGRTVLSESHSELPVQVQRPIIGARGEAIVTLLTPAGALFDGDEILLEVELGPDTDVVLRQTGATRLNRCPSSRIEFKAEFDIGRNARLRFLPYELIPFAGASYSQAMRVRLDEAAKAAFLEIVGPGRIGAPFAYTELSLRLEAWIQDELALVDAMRIRPAEMDCVRALGGLTHFGSLILLGHSFDQESADSIDAGLRDAGIYGSASLLPPCNAGTCGVGTRFLGTSADSLREGVRGAAHHLDLFDPV